MGKSGAERLDNPLKGMQTLVQTFLESSRMFTCGIHLNSIF